MSTPEIKVGQKWCYRPNGLIYDVVRATDFDAGMKHGAHAIWSESHEQVRIHYTLVEDVPVPPVDDSARLARVALEERLDKVERARVYAEDQARRCRSEIEATERRVEQLQQSISARDENDRGKIARQAKAIKDLEARNAKLVEKVAVQWARAEAAEYRAGKAERASQSSTDAAMIASLRDEVQRLVERARMLDYVQRHVTYAHANAHSADYVRVSLKDALRALALASGT